MKRLIALLAALVFVLSACALEAVRRVVTANDDPAGTAIDLEQDDTPPPRSPIAEIVAEALPSVVNVKVTSVSDVGLGQGEGSGVVIDSEGVILTNFHVVRGAIEREVEVVFNDDHGKLDGVVIGGIPERDLAIVRVDADDLDPIPIGRSSNLNLGDDVVAIGFPLGLGGPTVTKGIVSALDRSIEAGSEGVSLEGLLQTDAAINPGNSGGALIDRGGRLVGINTAAATASAAENIGFAIAIDDAMPVIEEILNDPPEDRAWMGITIEASIDSASDALQLGLDADIRGALIGVAYEDQPAAEAGLQGGELIVGINDTAIRSAQDLTSALARFDPGDLVAVEVIGPDGPDTFDVRLDRRPPIEG
jgi:S1-C subfamily serine protease